jgi:hypothetical protein
VSHRYVTQDDRDLLRVMEHPGFIEVSQWPDLREPWAVGLRLGDGHEITWLHGVTREAVVMRAIRAIEVLGVVVYREAA